MAETSEQSKHRTILYSKRIIKRATTGLCSTGKPVLQTCCHSDRGCTKLTLSLFFSYHIGEVIKEGKNKKEEKLIKKKMRN